MSNSVWRAVVATSLGGIIIAGTTFFFFTPREVDPREGLKVVYRHQKVPVGLFYQAWTEYAKHIDYKGVPQAADILKFFEYNNEVDVSTYSIDNKTGRTIQALSAKYDGGVIVSFVKDDKGARAIPKTDQSIDIQILPGSAAVVSIISDGRTYLEPPVKFLLADRVVEVREVEPWSFDPYSDAAEKSPFLAYMLWMSGGVFWFLAAVWLLTVLTIGRKPSTLATLTSSDTLGQYLALINYIKIENPPKFSRTVASAEKRFQSWLKPEPHNGDSGE